MRLKFCWHWNNHAVAKKMVISNRHATLNSKEKTSPVKYAIRRVDRIESEFSQKIFRREAFLARIFFKLNKWKNENSTM
jgi:hypothetical protein